MSLGLEQQYAQKLLQLEEGASKCKIWTRSKHDEIVDLMTKETCKEDKTPASKGLVVKPIVRKEFNSRGQMDLIDMQSLCYNDYRYIMVYQDHMTKCVVKRTPYKVMFGVEAKVDLTSSSLPDEIISKISTVDDPKDSTNIGFRNDFDIIEITDEVSGTGNADSVTCIVCQKPASNTHSCSKCSNTVHVICGKTIGEEGFGRSVLGFFKMWLLW
jgi:hypothetical protein